MRLHSPAGGVLFAPPAEKGKGKSRSHVYVPGKEAEAAAFIVDCNDRERRPIYYHANVPAEGVTTKAAKEQIAAAGVLHVDVDPRAGEPLDAERERIEKLLREYEPAPSIIVDSGGGMQAIWLLEAPVPTPDDSARDEIEAKNYALGLALAADDCWNIDRVLRLPGGVNWPDAKKRKKGRVPRLASLVRADWSLRYKLDQFPSKQRPTKAVTPKTPAKLATVGGHVRPEDLDLSKLSAKHREDLLDLLRTGRTKEKQYPSRSHAVYRAAILMVNAGVPQEVGAAILLNPDLAIHAHIRDAGRGGMARCAARQMARALAEVEKNFELGSGGKPLPSQKNIRLALAKLDVHVSYDEFADRLLIEGLDGFGPMMSDSAVAHLYLLVESSFGFRPSKDFFWMVVENLAHRSKFHPVREYLETLVWDKQPRLDRWLVTYGGAEDNGYTRAVGALTLIAAVRRVRAPGSKFDEMLVLESPQGKNKSTALRVLAVEDDWFSDDLPLGADTKRVIESLKGRLIVEAAELNGMRKSEVEHLKAFLSRQRDSARMAYARLETHAHRQCVIVGTTNGDKYLRDTTGNRRFWPVRVVGFDIAALTRDRDQLWAEAGAREATGESTRLDPALYTAAAEQQEERRVEDPWATVLQRHLGGRAGKMLTTDPFVILGVDTQHLTQDAQTRVGAAMRAMGYERDRARIGHKPEWCYLRGTKQERLRRIVVLTDDHGRFKGIGDDTEPPF